MIEQIGTALPFDAFYSTFGSGQPGLTVTVDVYKNSTKIVTAASATEVGDGFYTYTLAANLNDAEGVYKAIFKTETTTVDQRHLVGAWYVGKAGVEYLDASIAAIPSAAAIDTQLSGTHGAGAWGTGSGTGAISWTPERITDPSHTPIDGVQVWVSTDAVGTDIVARGYTNAFGLLASPFLLDAGTYYLWKQHADYEFTNPESVVVS